MAEEIATKTGAGAGTARIKCVCDLVDGRCGRAGRRPASSLITWCRNIWYLALARATVAPVRDAASLIDDRVARLDAPVFEPSALPPSSPGASASSSTWRIVSPRRARLYTLYAPRLAWIDIVRSAAFAAFFHEALRHRHRVQLHAGYLLATAISCAPIFGRLAPLLPGLSIRPAIWKLGVRFRLGNARDRLIAFAIAVRQWNRRRALRPGRCGRILVHARLRYRRPSRDASRRCGSVRGSIAARTNAPLIRRHADRRRDHA